MDRQSVAPRPGARMLRGPLQAAASTILLCLAPPTDGWAADSAPAGVVVAQRGSSWDNNWDDDWGDAWEDYNRTILQMQRESLSSQEEATREAAREKRREEIERDRDKAATEREEYFDAVLAASQASLRAPRGAYYRKPGYASADPPAPAASTAVEVGGMPYIYDQGIFWLLQGTDYVVVTAPAGATVAALPRGAVRVPAKDATLWYYFGTFFAGNAGAYTVVRPPPGISVYYLPDGYTLEKQGETDVYRFGETLFKPVFVQGLLIYQVVAGR